MDMDLTATPGMEPPAGHIPQFEGPYNYLQIGTIIAFAVTYFFATLFISLRYFQAFKLTQKVELDLGIVAGIRSVPSIFSERSYWIVIITVSYGIGLAYFVTMLDLFRNGWGKHMWDVSLAQLIELSKVRSGSAIYYLVSTQPIWLGITNLTALSRPSSPTQYAT